MNLNAYFLASLQESMKPEENKKYDPQFCGLYLMFSVLTNKLPLLWMKDDGTRMRVVGVD